MIIADTIVLVRDTVVSWLVRWTLDQVVMVQALVLGSWARHFTITMLLFTQVGTDKFNAGR